MEFDFDNSNISEKLSRLLSDQLENTNIVDTPKLKKFNVIGYLNGSKSKYGETFLLENAKAIGESLFFKNPKVKVIIVEETENKSITFEGDYWKEDVVIEPLDNVNIQVEWDEEKKNMFNKFLVFTATHLKYDEQPEITILKSREGEMTAGVYDPSNKTVKVLGGNRAFADILRSVAHELVHHQQNIQNRLNNQEYIPDVGGEIEDEANAVAGQIIKLFGKEETSIYDI